MGWSTREISELAGTSLRTVRHYHDIGLLEVPRRGSNGYKNYGAAHLVRLLRIRRLTELGFSLAQVAAMDAPPDDPAAMLRDVDAQLSETIARLQQARQEVAELLATSQPDLRTPGGLLAVADEAATDADRAYLTVIARVAAPAVLAAHVEMLRARHEDPVLRQFETLPATAPEASLEPLVDGLREHRRMLHVSYPPLRDLTHGSPVGHQRCAGAIEVAIADLYNPAQAAVLRRLQTS